jgi:NAD(P)-dependent dehydrogenase (short-subunit alcohol dehydrogenase family)
LRESALSFSAAARVSAWPPRAWRPQKGASVVIASSRKSSVDKALRALPAGSEGHVLDLADEPSLKALFAELGDFDHLLFTAGETLQLGPLPATEIAAARGFFNLRFWGAYMAAKYGSGSIRPGGSIVFTSGTAGARPRSGWSVGASVCAAMEGLTRALAVELAPIRVNIVAPGIVKTPLWGNVPEGQRENMYRDAAGEASRRPCRASQTKSRRPIFI